MASLATSVSMSLESRSPRRLLPIDTKNQGNEPIAYYVEFNADMYKCLWNDYKTEPTYANGETMDVDSGKTEHLIEVTTADTRVHAAMRSARYRKMLEEKGFGLRVVLPAFRVFHEDGKRLYCDHAYQPLIMNPDIARVIEENLRQSMIEDEASLVCGEKFEFGKDTNDLIRACCEAVGVRIRAAPGPAELAEHTRRCSATPWDTSGSAGGAGGH